MDPEVLREQLAKLHEELKSVRQVDPRSSQLLAEVLHDIQRVLEQQGRIPAAPSAPAARPAQSRQAELSLPERLEKIAVQFEVDHPTLAASSRRLVDLLGKVGL
jgi:Domain of unknown function (DUF4404)